MAGFELIEDTVLGSAAASITFNTGLTDYTKFRLTLYVIKDGTAAGVILRLNNDSGSNYSSQFLEADGAGAAGARATTTFARTSNATQAANSPSLITVEISKPLSSVPARFVTSFSGYTASGIVYDAVVSEWANTADAISQIDVVSGSGNFAAGTRAVLEGLSLANSITPSPVTFTWTLVSPSIALGASALVYQGVYAPQIVKKNVG